MQHNDLSFLDAKGEMAELMRSKNWAETSVGPAENWSQSLKTSLSIILNSKFPMFIFWGTDLVSFYNDAYIPSYGRENGKHPSMLGKKVKDAWVEEPQVLKIILELTDKVFAGEDSTLFHNHYVPIHRNGNLEDCYWTYCYSCIKDETGKVVGVLVTCMETTEQVIAAKALKESKDELKFAIDAAELGTFDFDLQINKVSVNNLARKWFNFGNDEEISQHKIADAIEPKDLERVSKSFKESVDFAIRAKHDIKYTLTQPKTGKKITLHSKGKAHFDKTNSVILQFNGTLQDITEQQDFTNELEKEIKSRTKKLDKANRELTEKNLKLEQINEELRSFSYISSHDLQEPLRKIQTFASRLLEHEYEVLSDRGKDYFNRMSRSANRMQNLIQDLLSYSKVDNQNNKKHKTQLSDIVREVTDNLQEEIESVSGEVIIGEMPIVKIIPFQFYQLFFNLFTNSLKFTKAGVPPKIKVTADIIPGKDQQDDFFDEKKSYCRIEFSDNGIGFDAEQNKLVFQLFQRLHGRSQYEGTGIGLAIVKKIVGNHEGKITASGTAGKGATFTIYIPQ